MAMNSEAKIMLEAFALGAFVSWFIIDGHTIQPQKQAVSSTCAALMAMATETTWGRLAFSQQRHNHVVSQALDACREAKQPTPATE